jgi:hypothetical protein
MMKRKEWEEKPQGPEGLDEKCETVNIFRE